MAQTKQEGPAAKLPPVTVARLEQATMLMERLVDENASVFVARGQAYRDEHRNGTSRPLNALEVSQVAAALAVDLDDAQQQIEAAGLAHHDEPEPQEVLLAAGIGTAPAFLRAALRMTALLELDPGVFEEACEADSLDEAVDALADSYRQLEISAMRTRAAAAFAHLAQASGVEPGKAWATVGQAIWQALTVAAGQLGAAMGSSSSTSSAAPTAASPAEKSSTT